MPSKVAEIQRLRSESGEATFHGYGIGKAGFDGPDLIIVVIVGMSSAFFLLGGQVRRRRDS